VQQLPDGRVRWPYRESETGQMADQDLMPDELLRRFLQHVLPCGYHRVRFFGWFHPASRKKLNRVRALFQQSPLLSQTEQDAWQPGEDVFQTVEPAETKLVPPPQCLRCKKPMVLVGAWRAGQTPLTIARAPP
jgi:hypothetical protein